ncbi:MAG: helix-hairpin-helix domain-containing protein [Chloroflexi bacterium]|nr:helix-hairpin-helix domain-containing protein [Chloroflexota bacterium]
MAIDANSASRRQLLALRGISRAIVDAIIRGRPYRDIGDLDRVPGIGWRRLQLLADQGLTVEVQGREGDVMTSQAQDPRATRGRVGGEEEAPFEVSELVEKLVTEPGVPPAAVSLHGVMGHSSRSDHVRLFFTSEFDSWADIPRDKILHAVKDEPEVGLVPPGVTVWIPNELEVQRVDVDAHRVRADFLAGDVLTSLYVRTYPLATIRPAGLPVPVPPGGPIVRFTAGCPIPKTVPPAVCRAITACVRTAGWACVASVALGLLSSVYCTQVFGCEEQPPVPQPPQPQPPVPQPPQPQPPGACPRPPTSPGCVTWWEYCRNPAPTYTYCQ